MELTLKRKTFFEGMSQLFRRKGENVCYERIITKVARGTGEAIETVLREFLPQLESEHSELLIIDPYMFAPSVETEIERLKKIILTANPSKLRLAFLSYNERVFSLQLRDAFIAEIKKAIPSTSIQFSNDDFSHDRFYINEEKGTGFVMGASLHDIGKKLCYIGMLSCEDIREVMAAAARQCWKDA